VFSNRGCHAQQPRATAAVHHPVRLFAANVGSGFKIERRKQLSAPGSTEAAHQRRVMWSERFEDLPPRAYGQPFTLDFEVRVERLEPPQQFRTQ
jgi:hypothetical protein